MLGPQVRLLREHRRDARPSKLREFRDAVQDGIAAAERYGGYVLTTSVEDEEEGRGSIVLRVPAPSFGRALTDLEELGKVNREIVSGQDVGQEFVDLQARLRNYTAQEAVLLKLMERSQSVTDTIRVQGELGKAWERAQDGFIAVIAGIIASLGVVVPLVILIGVVVFLFRLRPRLTP